MSETPYDGSPEVVEPRTGVSAGRRRVVALLTLGLVLVAAAGVASGAVITAPEAPVAPTAGVVGQAIVRCTSDSAAISD